MEPGAGPLTMAIFDGDSPGHADLAGAFAKWLDRRPGMSGARLLDFDQASVSNGYSNRTFRAVVRRVDGAVERLILRLPPTRKSLFPRYDLQRQFAFMQLLERDGHVPVNRTRWIESDASHLGQAFFVVDHVDGVVPPDSPMYHVAGWVYDAMPEQRHILWQSTVECLARLSIVRPDAPALALLDWPDRSRSRVRQQIDHWTALARWGEEGLPPSQDEMPPRLHRWLLENEPADDPAGIIWGDSRIGNIIYHGFRPAALLDWELAMVGDPEIDLAYFLIMQLYHETLRPETGLASMDPQPAARLEGFDDDRTTVALYEQVAGRKVRNIRYFWLLNAYKMYCMAQRMAAMQAELGLATVERAMIIRTLPSLTPHVVDMLEQDDPNALPTASRGPSSAKAVA